MKHEIKPLLTTVLRDHITIEVQPFLKEDIILADKFFSSIPDEVHTEGVTGAGGVEYLMFYGNEKQLYLIIRKLSNDFDLLIV